MEAGNTAEEGQEKKASSEDDSGEKDLSMEEILQSIRRIIAEDEEENSEDTEKETSEDTEKEPSPTKPDDDNVTESDVLELTDVIEEDAEDNPKADAKAEATEEKAKEEASPAKEEVPPTEKEEGDANDVLEKIDEALKPSATDATPDEDSLLSDDAASSASNQFERLHEGNVPANPETTPSPPLRSGGTVEDLVIEMLRPMMKEWLDQNLPKIVETIVEREVKKLAR